MATKRIAVAALAATAMTAMLGPTAQAASPPPLTVDTSTIGRELADWCGSCELDTLTIGRNGGFGVNGRSQIYDTDGKPVFANTMSSGHWSLFDSTGKQVLDADNAPISVEPIFNHNLRHADGTEVLDDEGKALNPYDRLDLHKLRASSIASEEAKLSGRSRVPLANPELRWAESSWKPAVGKVTTTDGSVLTRGLNSYTVRLNGKPVYTSDGSPVRHYGDKFLWIGGGPIKYPDGRVVDLSQPVDIPALFGTTVAKSGPAYEQPVEYKRRVEPRKVTVVERQVVPGRVVS